MGSRSLYWKISHLLPVNVKYGIGFLHSIYLTAKYSKPLKLDINQKYTLFITHRLGGGTETYIKNYLKEQQNQEILLVWSKYIKKAVVYYVQDVRTKKIQVVRTFDYIMKNYNSYIKDVFVNSLVAFYETDKVLKNLVEYKRKTKNRFTYLLHDFHCVCHGVHLVANGSYCNLRCNELNCKFKKREHPERFISNDTWHDNWNGFLKICDEIRGFSQSSINIVKNMYPDLRNEQFTCIPHDMSYCKLKPIKPQRNEIIVGICGDIYSEEKGMFIVRNFLKYCNEQNIKVVVLGNLEKCCQVKSKRFIYTGAYPQGRLGDWILKFGVNIIFFPSIWPETFSYLVSELIMLNIPILSFDIGAQGEKVSNYKKGKILPIDSKPDDIIHFIKENFCSR